MILKMKNIPVMCLLLIFILCLLISSCEDSVNQPVETAFLDIVILTNDSVRVEYDDDIIVNQKLFYSSFGYSAWIRKEQTKVGNHKIKFVIYDESIEATRWFYVEDTMQIWMAYYPEYGKSIRFGTKNHEFYSE